MSGRTSDANLSTYLQRDILGAFDVDLNQIGPPIPPLETGLVQSNAFHVDGGEILLDLREAGLFARHVSNHRGVRAFEMRIGVVADKELGLRPGGPDRSVHVGNVGE